MRTRVPYRILGLAVLLDACAGVLVLLLVPAPHALRGLGWLLLAPALLLLGACGLLLLLSLGSALVLRLRLGRNGPFPRELPGGRTKLPPHLLEDLARRSTRFLPRDEDYRAAAPATGAPASAGAGEGTAGGAPPAGKA
jgi:hypothetical protein